MLRVVILADIRLYRVGLAEMLGRREGIEVVGTAADGGAEFEDPGGRGTVVTGRRNGTFHLVAVRDMRTAGP